MDSMFSLQEALKNNARELEKELTLELEQYAAIPQHRFSRRYRRRKQQIITRGIDPTYPMILRKCLLIFFISIYVILSKSNSYSYPIRAPLMSFIKLLIYQI